MLSLLSILLACQQEEPKTLPVDTAPIAYYQPPVNSWPVCSEEIPADLNGTSFELNETIPNLHGIDQLNDMVSLYQFYGCITVVHLAQISDEDRQITSEQNDILGRFNEFNINYFTVVVPSKEYPDIDFSSLDYIQSRCENDCLVTYDAFNSFESFLLEEDHPNIILLSTEMKIVSFATDPTESELFQLVDAEVEKTYFQ